MPDQYYIHGTFYSFLLSNVSTLGVIFFDVLNILGCRKQSVNCVELMTWILCTFYPINMHSLSPVYSKWFQFTLFAWVAR